MPVDQIPHVMLIVFELEFGDVWNLGVFIENRNLRLILQLLVPSEVLLHWGFQSSDLTQHR